MLGFFALGQVALGLGASGQYGPIGGGGSPRRFHHYVPEPPYDEKPNKPFQPIWDYRRQQAEKKAAPSPSPAALPRVVPQPPASIFSQPAVGLSQQQPILPSFTPYGMHDPLALERELNDNRDMSDAVRVMQAIGLAGAA